MPNPELVVEATDNLNRPIQWSAVTNTPVVIDDQNTIEIEIDARPNSTGLQGHDLWQGGSRTCRR